MAAIYTNLIDITYQGNGITAEQKKYVTTLNSFKEVTEEQIWTIIHKSPNKCCLDPLPTWLLIKCKIAITPIIRNTINSSLNLYQVKEEYLAC